MHITVILVLTYIACCVRVGTAPWNYFQLNARYFSRDKGIFSKLSIDQLIPERWRLSQTIDGEHINPSEFPVFLKPEWGQNGSGIVRADDEVELQAFRQRHTDNRRFMIQQAATGKHEYEIFGIRSGRNGAAHDLITVTETLNDSESLPINSIHNEQTTYCDITGQFDASQIAELSSFIQSVGDFAISRVSVRTDSIDALLAGDFKIIEINLFIPMPINLLDSSYSWEQRLRFIVRAMMLLALATKALPPLGRKPAIFTRMMLYGRFRSASQRVNSSFNARRTGP